MWRRPIRQTCDRFCRQVVQVQRDQSGQSASLLDSPFGSPGQGRLCDHLFPHADIKRKLPILQLAQRSLQHSSIQVSRPIQKTLNLFFDDTNKNDSISGTRKTLRPSTLFILQSGLKYASVKYFI